LLQASENKLSLFAQQMEAAGADSSVKAVVLRVNSPGGTVTCSDTMYDIVKKFRADTHKPVITSAQEVMASGAYYVSCACDEIVAQPTSVVGSIGVIFNTYNVDQVGGLDDAIALAKKKSGATNAKVIMYKRPFGYTGSIYANTSTPVPQANVLRLELPEAAFLPRGFYYLWEPGS